MRLECISSVPNQKHILFCTTRSHHLTYCLVCYGRTAARRFSVGLWTGDDEDRYDQYDSSCCDTLTGDRIWIPMHDLIDIDLSKMGIQSPFDHPALNLYNNRQAAAGEEE